MMRGTTGTLSHTCALVGKHVKRIVIGGVDGFSYLVAAAVLVFCCLFIHRSPLFFSPYFMLSVFLWNYSIFLFSIFYSSSLICVTWFSLVVPVVLCDLTRAVASVCFSSVSLNPVLNVRCFHVLGFFSLSLSFFSSSFSGRGLWVERNFAPLAHSLFSQCKAQLKWARSVEEGVGGGVDPVYSVPQGFGRWQSSAGGPAALPAAFSRLPLVLCLWWWR